MSEIEYRKGNDIELDAMIELYRSSTLGERRPVGNREVMAGMLKHSDLTITAWDGDLLVGISRSLTDFVYVAYLADLAVHGEYQRHGIGKRLVEETRAALEPTCFITLLAAPLADDYYPKLGFERNPRAWVLPSKENPKR